jgi:curved DNA-binding protein CbpA
MKTDRTHYDILGISPAATHAEIKQTYRALAHEFHPDLIRDKSLGRARFVEINVAYRTLSDPLKRAHYDTDLAEQERVRRETVSVEELIDRSTRAFGRGDFLQARHHAEAAMEAAPNDYYAHMVLGDALVALKEIDAAREAYRKSIMILPSFIAKAKLDMLELTSPACQVVKEVGKSANATPSTTRRRTNIIKRFLRRD